jgi:predicted DNA-binding transcriptional regulator AlpA
VSGRNRIGGAGARCPEPRGGEPGLWVVDREMPDGPREQRAPMPEHSPAELDVGSMPRQLMSQRDLADFMQVDERTLRNWRHEGLVPPPVTVGRSPRWRRRDIERWIEELTP